MGDLIKAEDASKAISQEGEADEVKREAPRKKHPLKNLLDNTMPLDALEDEDEDEGEELMSVEEAIHKKYEQPKDEDSSEPETVEDIKRGLKDYLKSMYRRK